MGPNDWFSRLKQNKTKKSEYLKQNPDAAVASEVSEGGGDAQV